VADNSPDNIKLDEGDEATIKKISEEAEIFGHEIFMCPQCRLSRHPKSRPFSVYKKYDHTKP
jgi:hypothetical protein